jgi:hypothetical protein
MVGHSGNRAARAVPSSTSRIRRLLVACMLPALVAAAAVGSADAFADASSAQVHITPSAALVAAPRNSSPLVSRLSSRHTSRPIRASAAVAPHRLASVVPANYWMIVPPPNTGTPVIHAARARANSGTSDSKATPVWSTPSVHSVVLCPPLVGVESGLTGD